MSTNLYWDIVKEKEHKSLDNQLKYILAPKYWNHDGSLRGEDIFLVAEDIPYLCGIRDGSRDKDIKKSIDILVDAIQKYKCVKIWLE